SAAAGTFASVSASSFVVTTSRPDPLPAPPLPAPPLVPAPPIDRHDVSDNPIATPTAANNNPTLATRFRCAPPNVFPDTRCAPRVWDACRAEQTCSSGAPP